MFDPRSSYRSGSLHILVDAFYTGPITETYAFGQLKGQTHINHYLLIALSHKSKEGKITNRFRRIKMNGLHNEEFRMFFKAYFGMGLEEQLDFKSFASDIIKDIEENKYNFMIQFSNDPKSPCMVSMSKIKPTVPEKICAGMLWRPEAIRLYNELEENNERLIETYGGLLTFKKQKRA